MITRDSRITKDVESFKAEHPTNYVTTAEKFLDNRRKIIVELGDDRTEETIAKRLGFKSILSYRRRLSVASVIHNRLIYDQIKSFQKLGLSNNDISEKLKLNSESVRRICKKYEED